VLVELALNFHLSAIKRSRSGEQLKADPKNAGDRPNFAQSAKQNGTVLPFSEANCEIGHIEFARMTSAPQSRRL
jgi:hypothetical protein